HACGAATRWAGGKSIRARSCARTGSCARGGGQPHGDRIADHISRHRTIGEPSKADGPGAHDLLRSCMTPTTAIQSNELRVPSSDPAIEGSEETAHSKPPISVHAPAMIRWSTAVAGPMERNADASREMVPKTLQPRHFKHQDNWLKNT